MSNERVARQAREWHTLMNSGVADEATRQAFEGWLHADRANKQAYFDLEQMWRDLDFAAVSAEVDVAGALQEAARPRRWTYSGRRAVAVLAGSAGLCLAALALFLGGVPHAPAGQPPATLSVEVPDYATAVAEVREVLLEDGTRVTLGPKSEMNVTFTSDSRNVILLAGEAFFEVTADPQRPFFVSADDTLVRVVGTKFDVKRAPGDVHVSVLEGVVDVMKPRALEPDRVRQTGAVETKRLVAGQKIIAAASLPAVKEIEQAQPGAWRSGRLAYEDASLSEIIADLNRYSDRPIRIAGGGVAEVRLTTAFRSSEIEAWLDVLARSQGLTLEDQGKEGLLIRPLR
ncbi:hypothetical protein BBF93_06705 [Hyphomonas sp. CACIAM 19H1]|uniref:FecR family protein n=1 Tax=Hyphomonas sp. CACIAM 19H1 TaxID=1873716 RepID=UPI000DEDDA3A|nr:FecR domain-containing protein [Hyphomonas sp. CACIAM 19H1]AXE63941.1 hypothetical protein BBF93_06705 [Hyphomonas sp. CACIAM 19H1]